jgi:hypothetical protein
MVPIAATQLSCDQDGQERSNAANVASDGQKFLGGDRVFVRQPFETRTDSVKVLNFIQDWLVTHFSAPFLSG